MTKAKIKTNLGDITISFLPKVAPKHVENFIKLANDKFYDGTSFHRVIPGFMIQGGCPNSKKGASGQPGTSGPGYNIDAEFNAVSHKRGIVSMARSQDPNSAGSQFFIVHKDSLFLDNNYTVFGKVESGMEIVDKIAQVSTDGSDKPTQRVEMEKIEILD
ncbi:MAG: peptidylprolyl isomerase [Deltaproteobacteria bacterium]|jgi:peptidyl-prolyl cis-trans isomerase B (cyclophilin B)|nr:peptidylprolyl isomerase [Deltaproteobacteria bacterium]